LRLLLNAHFAAALRSLTPSTATSQALQEDFERGSLTI
jgi:hypothetical protein